MSACQAGAPVMMREEIRLEGGIHEARVAVVKKLPLVMVVSDVRLLREGMVAMLARTGKAEVIGDDGRPDRLRGESPVIPDVVLLDVGSLESLGVPLLLASARGMKIIAFGVSGAAHELTACAKAGVCGLIERNGSADDVLLAIDAVRRGEFPCSQRIAGALFQCLSATVNRHAHRPAVEGFSCRELEVADYLERGWSNKKIARQLEISAATVKNHVHKLLAKLQVHRRGEVATALRNRQQLQPARWSAMNRSDQP